MSSKKEASLEKKKDIEPGLALAPGAVAVNGNREADASLAKDAGPILAMAPGVVAVDGNQKADASPEKEKGIQPGLVVAPGAVAVDADQKVDSIPSASSSGAGTAGAASRDTAEASLAVTEKTKTTKGTRRSRRRHTASDADRRARTNNAKEEKNDDDSIIGDDDSYESQPGAVAVAGLDHVQTLSDEILISVDDEDELNEDEINHQSYHKEHPQAENLVEAELAPIMIQVRAVPMEEGSSKEEGAENANDNRKSAKKLIFGFVAVVVVVIVGAVVGISSSNRRKESFSRGNGSSSNSNKTLGSPSNPLQPSGPSPSPTSFELSNDIYEVDPAYQGYNRFWTCTNDTNWDEGNFSESYLCVHLLDQQVRDERRTGGYPYFFYNTQLTCQCSQPLVVSTTDDFDGNDNSEDYYYPPTNENCPQCDIFFWIGSSSFFCLWVHLTNVTSTGSTTTPREAEEMFQIQYDCSNIFWKQLANAVDKSCVGRDENGNCFDLDGVPSPPLLPNPTSEIMDDDEISSSRTIFRASGFNCLDEPFSNGTAIFGPIRGRYQCASGYGVPYSNTKIRTVLACTTSDGYFLGADCNCIIFLGDLSFDMTCSSCEVIPDGNSNETLRLEYDCSNRFDGECVGYDANGTCFNSTDVPQVCTYYDEISCQEKALELGLWLGGVGFTFSGNYITKGCQYYKSDHPLYANHAYFGLGSSSIKEMEATPTEGNHRLTCDTTIDNPPTQQACPIFDADSCAAVATAAGLSLGNDAYTFEGCAYNPIPGCYYEPRYADPLRANTAHFCPPSSELNYTMLTLPTGSALRFLCNTSESNSTIFTNNTISTINQNDTLS